MSQNDAILNYLQKGHKLTPLQALRKFNCLSLSSRISDLKNDRGYDVKSELVKVGKKTVSQYTMEVK